MKAQIELLRRLGGRARIVGEPARGAAAAPLIESAEIEEFALAAALVIAEAENGEVLGRAVVLAAQSDQSPPEVAFIGLYAALESVLTFARRREDFDILAPAQFARIEKDLRAWLRQHPVLAGDARKRALIYEKARELNRFPFSHVFNNFCARHGVELSDQWPLLGRREEWPLVEIRHRLVHGDPFRSRPAEALACARQHVSWTVERMLLAALGWPVGRSGASVHGLKAAGPAYTDWPAARSKLS